MDPDLREWDFGGSGDAMVSPHEAPLQGTFSRGSKYPGALPGAVMKCPFGAGEWDDGWRRRSQTESRRAGNVDARRDW